MRKYLVNVDNEEFVVKIKLVDEDGTVATEEPKTEVKKETKSPAKPKTVDGEKVDAPLGGSILSIKVNPGDKVSAGDVLMTLEALKLENEINAPCDGTVAEILTSEGATVESGDPLAVIDKE